MTTKLHDDDQGFEKALEACELSLEKLGLEYIGKFCYGHGGKCGSRTRSVDD